MKLTTKDIKMLGRNGQIRLRITEKFGSIEQFAEAVEMSAKSVNQYLNESREYNKKFKEKLEKHFGKYDDLVKDEAEQTREFAYRVGWDIHFYTEESDIEVLELLMKLSHEYGTVRGLGMSYWNMGMYYLNKGGSDVSLRFFILGRDYAQKAEDNNLETLVVLKMITAYTYLGKYKDANSLIREFEDTKKIEKADSLYKFWYYYSVANLYVYEKDYYWAKEMLTRAKKFADNDYRTSKYLNLLGVCNKKERDYNTALALYTQALDLAEDDISKARCYNNIAELYHTMKCRELAEENIDKAMALVKANNVKGYLPIYETYADIKGTKENINKLIDAIEDTSSNIIMPFVLVVLSKIVNKNIDIERIRRIIIKYVEYNTGNDNMKEELYNLLGKLHYKEVTRT